METQEQKAEQDPSATGALVPPYFAFKTLLSQLDFMKERGVPSRIDRSFLVGMSGAGQTQFITGLRSLGLIDSAGTVQPQLTALAQASVSDRKRLLREVLHDRYAKAIELGSSNATTGQLVELFRNEYGATGDTARKGIAFYLNAARFAGDVPLSPMFQTPKVSSSGGSTKKRRKPNDSLKPAEETDRDDEDDGRVGLPRFHQILSGVISEFPSYPTGWTKTRRDEVMKMFEMAVDFTIPVKTEAEIEIEEEADDEEAVDLLEE